MSMGNMRFGIARVARSNRPESRGVRQYVHSHYCTREGHFYLYDFYIAQKTAFQRIRRVRNASMQRERSVRQKLDCFGVDQNRCKVRFTFQCL